MEGQDGCGKTTLVTNLKNYFSRNNITFLHTKEFGSELNKFCSEMRKLALSSEYNTDELAGQFAFAAIATQHQERVIKPNIESGEYNVILSDRGIDSNYCYGPEHVKKEDRENLKKLFDIAYKGAFLPDLTILLDISPELSAKRRSQRPQEAFNNQGKDRVEMKGDLFQSKVRKNFLKRAKKNPERIVIVKITEETTPDSLLNQVIETLKRKNLIP